MGVGKGTELYITDVTLLLALNNSTHDQSEARGTGTVTTCAKKEAPHAGA